MSCTLLRVVAMYWSTSASPPRIFSVALTWVNVGVLSAHVSPTSKNAALAMAFSRL